MSECHTIRLRGPWELRRLDDSNASTQRVDFADFERLDQIGQTIELVRRFNKPSGLDHGERIELIVDSAAGVKIVELNDERLSAMPDQDELRFDITAHLRPRNSLRLLVDSLNQLLLTDVRLEIK